MSSTQQPSTATDKTRSHHAEYIADEPVLRSNGAATKGASEQAPYTVAVAATFSADPLRGSLQFWSRELQLNYAIELAPYAQVLQEFLNPDGLFGENIRGVNVLLLRVEDWIRDTLAQVKESDEDNIRKMERVADELLRAVATHRLTTSAPLLVIQCPFNRVGCTTYYELSVARIAERVATELGRMSRVFCWSFEDINRLYPTDVLFDITSDRLAHIPFTAEYFVAIATFLARRIACLVRPQLKVIAVDCDNTLWKGVCGEVGPEGVTITEENLSLQRLLLTQCECGVLLCLCSKNREKDVMDVLEKRPEMILRAEHFVAARVNWNPKSDNLISLAEELGLALNTFAFLDDSEVECAEVKMRLPEVITMCVPGTSHDMRRFIDHNWIFDKLEVTDEARRRAEQYKENKQRKAALSKASSLQEFLNSLQLQVDVEPPRAEQLNRMAELIQRTTQFNLTGVRRITAEIGMMLESGELQGYVINVRDRFGDYGLTGVVLTCVDGHSLDVDTFVLSCRVLGRGVEQKVMSALAEPTRAADCTEIVLRYRRTERNSPAWQFLTSSYSEFCDPGVSANGADEQIFRIPVTAVEGIAVSASAEIALEASNKPEVAPSTRGRSQGPSWETFPDRFSNVTDIGAAIEASAGKKARGEQGFAEPRNPLEASVARVWKDVLLIDKVGATDNFFALGGDSLLAVRAISRMESEFGLWISLSEFFEESCLESVARRLRKTEHRLPIVSGGVDTSGVLSSAQRRLWFIYRLEGASAAYHIAQGYTLSGHLDEVALRAAFDAIFARHDALRTTFVEIDGEPRQVVRDPEPFPLSIVDLSNGPGDTPEQEVRNLERAEIAREFDLEKGPLIRGLLMRGTADHHVLLLVMHHIVSDGWSVGIIARELGALYDANKNDRVNPLRALALQYVDYAAWSAQRPERVVRDQEAFWMGHLRAAPPYLELPYDAPRPSRQSYRGRSVEVRISSAATKNLRALSRRENVTLVMSLYAVWLILLSRLSGKNDIVSGMPVANRRNSEVEGVVGFFVNTLALRCVVNSSSTVSEFLREVKRVMLDAVGNQEFPFERAVEIIQPERSLSYSPIFQVLFVFQNATWDRLRLSEVRVSKKTLPVETAQFDLSLSLEEDGEQIAGTLNYASDIFAETTVKRWVGYFEALADDIGARSDQRISCLRILSDEEQDWLRRVSRGPITDTVAHETVETLFEKCAAENLDRIAVVSDGQYLSYSELRRRTDQLSCYISEVAKSSGEYLVGLYFHRGIEMIIGVLATLKSGGAYLPLDSQQPLPRLEYMLAESKPKVILTQSSLISRLPRVEVAVVATDTAWPNIDRSMSAQPLLSCDRRVAYAIYTSGSTGTPKGVLIEHRSVLNHWHAVDRLYTTPFDCRRVGFNAPLTFDASVQQWTQLLSGRTVFVVPESARVDSGAFLSFVQANCLQGVDCTPSQLNVWFSDPAWKNSHSLRTILVGGEAIDSSLWARMVRAEGKTFFNVYGPTECTVDSTCARVSDERHPPTIGGPLDNAMTYIVDRDSKPVPTGVRGDIYISGLGIARGYMNQPALTAERFVADPLSAVSGRMYRTGDVGRWLTDGSIEYLGRDDQQVKIRGYRIEIGEIEGQLASHSDIKEAVVLAREDVPGDRRLVAYVVLRDRSDAARGKAIGSLRSHLQDRVPTYMVPSAFVFVEAIPRTSSGKLNRRLLPPPDRQASATSEYEKPLGEVEEILARVWEDLLQVKGVGRRDNFFELGGHSLLILRMVQHLRRAGLSPEVRGIFEKPTLAEFARELTSRPLGQLDIPKNLIPLDCLDIRPEMLPLVALSDEEIRYICGMLPGGARNIKDIYPLAPLQEGILFHHLMNRNRGDTYVLPTLLRISTPERLVELVGALQKVIDTFDVLRTAIVWEHLSKPVQIVYRCAKLSVQALSLSDELDELQALKEYMRPERQELDLRQAPLLRLRTATGKSGVLYALVQLHHIISDHVTAEAIVTEVVRCLEKSDATLSGEIGSYRDHVARLMQAHRKDDALPFFTNKLGSVTEPTAPFGLLDVHGDGSEIEEARAEVDPETAARVRLRARRLSVSAATLFHAAWALVVGKTSGSTDVVFGSVLLGRLQAGAERVMGMFINTLPLRLNLSGTSVLELVENVQQELLGVLLHEQTSLSTAQRCSSVPGTLPLFTSLLNYRHSDPNHEIAWSRARGIEVLAVQERTNYPVVVSVDDLGAGFTLTAQTDRRVDANTVLAYLRQSLRSLLAALEQTPGFPALSLAIMPLADRARLLEFSSGQRTDYPRELTIHAIFERQVGTRPDAMAAIFGESRLTYAALDSLASRVSRFLIERGVGIGDRVAILLPRSLDMLVCQLGTLKSRAAYIPIDPEFPLARQQQLIEDCGASIVFVTRETHNDALTDPTSVRYVTWADVFCATNETIHDSSPAPMSANLPAYVMYTSGSTGKPKGVMVPHRAITRLVVDTNYVKINDRDCIAHCSNPAFDASTFEIWGALLNGASVCIIDPEVALNSGRLSECLYRNGVTVLWLTVGLLAQYVESLADVFARLRYLLTGGDVVPPELARKILKSNRPEFLLNGYGPTECTTFSTAHEMEGALEPGRTVPIGRPIANTQTYILDDKFELVPAGVAGEIYIGGDGLASGYLSRPELTAACFVADPFGKEPGARLYRTGDKGRWRSDSVIEYLGRADRQVKIRGFRIELEEIEAQLRAHPLVAEAIVLTRPLTAGGKAVVAYVTPDSAVMAKDNLTGATLREHMKSALPEYMVPSAFVVLERFPLTPNGKVDRESLPKPRLEDHSFAEYEPPRGRVEETIASAWRHVLQLERVGRTHNFFDLGGHSLTALKSMFQIDNALGTALSVSDIYKYPTVARLAESLQGQELISTVDLVKEAVLEPDIAPSQVRRTHADQTVLVTGATGFVGRYLLTHLLTDRHAVAYCLVRGVDHSDAKSRLKKSLVKWGLWQEDFAHRVIVLAGNLSAPRLGLDEASWSTLSRNMDAIYHCGTSMNHLETYSMAAPANVGGTKELLRLATTDREKLLNYISTVSVFSHTDSSGYRVVSESSPIEHERHFAAAGYAASKWVAEKCVMEASQRGIPCNIFRLGLIWADTQQGRYDELQREYRFMKTCLLTGLGISNYRFFMPPTPVDYVARATVALAKSQFGGGGIFHVASDREQIGSVFEHLSEWLPDSLNLMPFPQWRQKVRDLYELGQQLPAAPLLDESFNYQVGASAGAAESREVSPQTLFDSARTRAQLLSLGIETPVVGVEHLEKCLRDMMARDHDLETDTDSHRRRFA